MKTRPPSSTSTDSQRLAARQTNRTALSLSLVSGLLLWASFPPLNLSALAWIAPVPWLLAARLPREFTWRTYGWLYLGGLAHWLAMLEGIRLAHPALIAGWITLAAYVAGYTPLFVWLCRAAMSKLRMPLVAAAPVLWVGLELIRGYFVTGFSAGLLGHTQIAWTSLLQVSDLVGAYGVSFLLAIVAAAVAQLMPNSWLGSAQGEPSRWTFWPVLPAAAAVGAALVYGHYRLGESPPKASGKPLRVALVQGSLDTVFDTSEAEHRARVDRTFKHYEELTREACDLPGGLDLLIWPESMFALVERRVVEPLQVPEGLEITADELRGRIGEVQADFDRMVKDAAAMVNSPAGGEDESTSRTYFLFGTTTLEYGPHEPKQFNVALLADPEGRIVDRYYKVHPVMFGEYIPFGEWFPWIYKLTPLPGGLDRGPGPTAMNVAGKRLSPCICFENVVPHLVRGHVLELTRRDMPPDVLVTVTNDGWFYGSSILDLHFRCAVFRAIENRRPMLIAANTGLSAYIDASGRQIAVGPRRSPKVLVVQVHPDGRTPPYHLLGDWLAIACALFCGLAAIAACWRTSRPGTARTPRPATEVV